LPSTDVPRPILDFTTTTSVLNIGNHRIVADVNVTLDITHTYDSDLTLTLIGPNGVSVLLSQFNGGSGDNYTSTTFDDEAPVPIAAGTAPFSGSFRPQGLLSALDGIPANGTWQLQVTDSASQDVGTLNSWSLRLEYADRRPSPSSVSGQLEYGGVPVTVSGTRFRGDSEANGGGTNNSATGYPLVHVQSLENGTGAWLLPDPRASFSDEPMTLGLGRLPPSLDPGWYELRVATNGMPSPSLSVRAASRGSRRMCPRPWARTRRSQ
jgi:subtilisin-like proprotein convertase family protein